MRKSLCCISLKLQERGFKANTMTKSRFLALERVDSLEILSKRVLNNVNVTKETIKYCIDKGWNYRVSSDLFPLKTLPEADLSFDCLPDKDKIDQAFRECAILIKNSNIRCSTHPDQFVVPASANESVAQKSIVELTYHADIMDRLGLPRSYNAPINIHMNCYKGDLKATAKRFIEVFRQLPEGVKSRLVLENEDKPNSWNVDQLYNYIYQETGIPITYDNLHFQCNTGGLTAKNAVTLAKSTWGSYVPLFHFSDNDVKNRNPRAHADYPTKFPEEFVGEDIDLDFEFKAKDYAIEYFESNIQK
jgi:UV DNA damage endonuclease